MSATIRTASGADVAAIMTIERAAFPRDAWSEAAMAATVADPSTVTFVAETEDGVVGYAAVLAPPDARDADVLTIAVAEPERGTGIGRELLQRLLAAAAARGARRVFLEVRADNPVAQRLYASEGFEPIGRRRRYYQPDDVDAVVMRLPLGVRAEEAW